MFLSHLLINVGDNPDRPRPGRLWLRNMYRVHQRLCMAFPSPYRKEGDADFLKPYAPSDFPEDRSRAIEKKNPETVAVLKQVHAKRSAEAGFLFRVDPLPGASPAIVVLSAARPDWDYAFRNAEYLLAAKPDEPREACLAYPTGSRLRFRLLANPVFRVSKGSVDMKENPLDAKWIGKRVPVPGDQLSLTKWLEKRALSNGFALLRMAPVVAGYINVRKTNADNAQRLRSARYDGILQVTDEALFARALQAGIGPQKAYGFGLLSVAPA